MDKSEMIRIRMMAFQSALQLMPVHFTDEGEMFNCPDYDIYEESEKIKMYILEGKVPDDELKDLLKN